MLGDGLSDLTSVDLDVVQVSAPRVLVLLHPALVLLRFARPFWDQACSELVAPAEARTWWERRRVVVAAVEALLLHEFRRYPRHLEVLEVLELGQGLLGTELAVSGVVVLVVVDAVRCGHQVSLGVVEVCPDGDLGADDFLLGGEGIDGLVRLHRID